MKKTVYIAGASKEIERAEWARASLAEHGIPIAYDWMAEIRKHGEAEISDLIETYQIARREIAAVCGAAAIWVLWPSTGIHSTGLHTELGAALAAPSHPLVLISGPGARRGPFWTLGKNFDTDAEAVRILRGLYG